MKSRVIAVSILVALALTLFTSCKSSPTFVTVKTNNGYPTSVNIDQIVSINGPVEGSKMRYYVTLSTGDSIWLPPEEAAILYNALGISMPTE